MTMTTHPDRSLPPVRTFVRSECAVFLRARDSFGGLSNMSGSDYLYVNNISIRSSEALYQACRFPHDPALQRLIMSVPSPMTAKMWSRHHLQESRSDWDEVRVPIMRWCLRVRLAQNWSTFGELLLASGDKPIVEESSKDDFWGAKPTDEHTLVGMNVLGSELEELRELAKTQPRDMLLRVDPLAIPDFRLGGRPITVVTADQVLDHRDLRNWSLELPGMM